MAGEINREEIKNEPSDSGKELDYGPKRVTFGPGEEVFLKDPKNGDILGYEIPEGRKLEVFFLGKINKENEKTSCIAIEFYRKTEEGKYINDLPELQLEGTVFKYIRRGVKVLCYSKDLIKQLEAKEQAEKVESEGESKGVEPEEKETENVGPQQKRYEEIGKALKRSGKYIHNYDD